MTRSSQDLHVRQSRVEALGGCGDGVPSDRRSAIVYRERAIGREMRRDAFRIHAPPRRRIVLGEPPQRGDFKCASADEQQARARLVPLHERPQQQLQTAILKGQTRVDDDQYILW